MECFQIIKQTRKTNGLTQSQIADILNMSQTNYAKIENNRISI
ncbi:MAG: helix-turn-helix transcriptional regulator [Clostridia bacterium]|nr:helix-turn-helix transcriptional regulator [Clostridia bacterium]